MSDLPAQESTSAIRVPYVQVRRELTETVQPRASTVTWDTEMIGVTRPDISAQASGTAFFSALVGAEAAVAGPSGLLLVREEGSPDPGGIAERANRDRLELLARQFVKNRLSNEDFARLVIVQQRVARLMPRVSREQWATLESIAKATAEIGDRLDKLQASRGKKRRSQ